MAETFAVVPFAGLVKRFFDDIPAGVDFRRLFLLRQLQTERQTFGAAEEDRFVQIAFFCQKSANLQYVFTGIPPFVEHNGHSLGKTRLNAYVLKMCAFGRLVRPAAQEPFVADAQHLRKEAVGGKVLFGKAYGMDCGIRIVVNADNIGRFYDFAVVSETVRVGS